MQPEFELACHYFAAKDINHYASEVLPNQIRTTFRRIFLIYRWDLNRFYHSRSEWTEDYLQWSGTLPFLDFQNWSLIIRCRIIVTYPWYGYVKYTYNIVIHEYGKYKKNVHNSYIDNIGIPKHKKHLRLLSSGTKLFITFKLKGFRHKEREAQSFYADFSSAPNHVRPPPQTTGLASVNKRKSTLFFRGRNSNHWLFSNPPLPVHDVNHIPLVIFSIWDFYFDISEWHNLPVRVWTHALMLHLTNPCAKRKVLSLTKPKGKIYNEIPRSLYYIMWSDNPFNGGGLTPLRGIHSKPNQQEASHL